MSSTPVLILASNSPRRNELLKAAGFQFSIKVESVEEDFPETLDPEKVAEYLAVLKNDANRKGWGENEIILTADTTVVVDKEVLNKPSDAAEAREMLNKLSGRSHQVYTGVCISSSAKKISFTTGTTIEVDQLRMEEIEFYIDRFQPYDKAGAYGIQEWFGLSKISRINGSYSNVVGLPVREVYSTLTQEFGLAIG